LKKIKPYLQLEISMIIEMISPLSLLLDRIIRKCFVMLNISKVVYKVAHYFIVFVNCFQF